MHMCEWVCLCVFVCHANLKIAANNLTSRRCVKNMSNRRRRRWHFVRFFLHTKIALAPHTNTNIYTHTQRVSPQTSYQHKRWRHTYTGNRVSQPRFELCMSATHDSNFPTPNPSDTSSNAKKNIHIRKIKMTKRSQRPETIRGRFS